MSKSQEKIVVTTALPYANGPLHLGHLLEHIQSDIFVRFLKLQGKHALSICAADMHGTPIEVHARKRGISPEELTKQFFEDQQEDFKKFLIQFDNYHSTHSKENKEMAEYFFNTLKEKGEIYLKDMDVVFCQSCDRTLPDRFVKGTCPSCGTEDQYGDICESCGITLKGTDLLNPFCTLCNSTPIVQTRKHYFFKLSNYSKALEKWIKESDIQPEVRNWLKGWLQKGLEDWCVSRDAPYFGFTIPGSKEETGQEKFFYVWLDAPIGYISSTMNYCDKHGGKWQDYWNDGKVYSFIGKDIVYFHYLFWPAMLMGVGINTPTLSTHGFVTVDGKKMSKTRGTFFTAKEFYDLYGAEALRFYFASHLQRKVADINLSFTDFQAVINNVLIGKLGNFCYRTLTFAQKNYDTIAKAAKLDETTKVTELFKTVELAYERQDTKLAVKTILEIADIGNLVFQEAEPWKDPELKKGIIAWCVNLAKNLAIIVSPILPEFSGKVYASLSLENPSLKDRNFNWIGKVTKPKHLVKKIETVPENNSFPLNLVVGRIEEVKDHPNADSLYLLKVNFGRELGFKQVVSGLKKFLPPIALNGRKAVFCVNLKPAKLRGEISEAMSLTAEDGSHFSLLLVDKTELGSQVQFGDLNNSTKQITPQEFQKLKITVSQGNVLFDGHKLHSKVEDVTYEKIRDGGVVR